MRFTFLSLAMILAISAFPVHAKMYKWKSDEGQIHFGDKIPAKYLVKEHDELNEQGVKVKHKAAAKTEEEKAEDLRLQYEKKKAALIAKKKKQRDRVLLDTYTTERDLTEARDSRLDAVNSQIQLATTIISNSNKKIEGMEKRIVAIQESNREVPLALYDRLELEKEQVVLQEKVKQAHIKRQSDISTQFTEYIERFKALKSEQQAIRERIAKERGY